MSSICPVLLFLLCVFFTSASGAQPSDESCYPESRREIEATLEALSVALGSNDLTALEKLWSNDYRYVRKDGVVMDKRTRIERVRAGVARHSLVRYADPVLRCYGDAATVMTRTLSQSEGAAAGSDLQVTHILQRIETGWQVTLTHATAIAAEPID